MTIQTFVLNDRYPSHLRILVVQVYLGLSYLYKWGAFAFMFFNLVVLVGLPVSVVWDMLKYPERYPDD